MNFAKIVSGSKKQQPNTNRNQVESYASVSKKPSDNTPLYKSPVTHGQNVAETNINRNQKTSYASVTKKPSDITPLYKSPVTHGQNVAESNINRNQKTSYASVSKKPIGNTPLYKSPFSYGHNIAESSRTNVLRPPLLQSPRYNARPNSYQLKIFTQKVETPEEKKNRLISLLSKFETPFNWKPRQVKPINDPEIIIYRMQEKDKEVVDERSFKWRNFIFHLVICYEYWRAEKVTQAFVEVSGLEAVLIKKIKDFFFNSIEEALWHVVRASKAFLLLEQGLLTEAEALIENIQPRYTMCRQNQAGLHGIRAAMFMEYGHRGNERALEEACEAVNLDRTCAEWHFLVCKCFGRIRRVAKCHDLVYMEELIAINKASGLDPRNAIYKVFLGQVLQEQAFRLYKVKHPDKKSDLYKRICKINGKAFFTLKEAAELSPDSPRVLIRCARGLMKLPPSLKDLQFTKECIDKALKLAPNNPMVHHVQGMYHERFDCEAELPLQAYEQAASFGNFGAEMDLVRLHFKQNKQNSNIVEELEALANKFEQENRLQVIYAQAGSYMLFIKKDIIGAIKYFSKVVEIDDDSYAMKSHKSLFIRMKDPVNMFDVLLEELANKTEWESFPPKDRQVLRNFRISILNHQPPPNEVRKRLTVAEILEMAKKTTDEHTEKYNLKKRQNKRTKSIKKWHGRKKQKKNQTKVESNDIERLKPEGGTRKQEKEVSNKNAGTKRRDSVSSVDSDYRRDSTLPGRRDFFLRSSNESLCSTKSDRTNPYTKDHTLYPSKESSGIDNFHCRLYRNPRDSSLSSVSSVCSSVDSLGSQESCFDFYPKKASTQSQLTVENVKNIDSKNSQYTGKCGPGSSSSCASSISQASSSKSLSVMDRVKKSYAMLGRNSGSTQEKKHFKKHGSTQSLNATLTSDWKKDLQNKNITRTASSQSLNVEENVDCKFSKSLKLKYTSRDSNIQSKSSLFMPDFARKN